MDFDNYYRKELNMSPSVLDSYKKRPKMSFTSNIHSDGSYIDVFAKLIEKRIIYLGDGLDSEVANIIKAQLLYLNEESDEDIKMFIDSPGGEVYTSLGILDTMDYVSCDVSTINTGLAASMGAILLAYGTKGKRKSLKRSKTMIHQPLGGGWGQASDLEINAKEIMKVKKELYNILVDCTGKPYKTIETDGDRDYWMTAKEAKKYGLIDIIL